jgi:hypothetical protein
VSYGLRAADTYNDDDAPWEDGLSFNNHAMSNLRGIIRGAGVTDPRIFRKLALNDELVLTPRQCQKIADKLWAWLDTDDHVAPHWDDKKLRAYWKREHKRTDDGRPDHVDLHDDGYDACFHPHPVEDKWLLDQVAELADLCDRMAQRKGIVVC